MTRKQIQRFLSAALAVSLLTAVHVAAQRGADPETRFRDALQKQQVQGDLNGAIQIYQEIVASGTASRALKARALLQLGTAMETQGQQAETVYQRILKEFDDQPAASNARTRLAALKPPASAAMSLTRISFGSGVQNVVATDGQRALYWDEDRTKLFIGDIAGKARKQVFATTPQRRPRVEVSRDLSMAFLYFVPTEGNPEPSYAVIRTDGSGAYREISLSDKGFNASRPLYGVSWAFDNRSIVLCNMAEDRIVHVLKLSIDDGKIVDLLPGRTTNALYAALSPDGRSIALQDAGIPGAVYIKSVQGGDFETLTSAGIVADWTLDGRLVFGVIEKEGLPGLFTVPVRDGRSIGERNLVRGFTRTNISRMVTSGNSLVFGERVEIGRGPRVSYASLDAEGHLGQWNVLRVIPGYGNAYPVSSPDGTRVAYVVRSPETRSSAIRVYTVASGEDRELHRRDGVIGNCVWASQPVLYCAQPLYPELKTAILSIDAATGRADSIATFPGDRVIHALSADQRTLWMHNLSGPTNWPSWEIGAAQEIPGPQSAPYRSFDGRWAFRVGTDSANRREYSIRPASAGEEAWEHLVYVRKQAGDARSAIALKFTHDSNWLVYHDVDAAGKDALFRVSTSGGEPQRLGNYPTKAPNSYLNITPDGRHFLVEAVPDLQTSEEAPQMEYWQLQNLPSATSTAAKP